MLCSSLKNHDKAILHTSAVKNRPNTINKLANR